jgi:hypothetical protein
VGALPGWKVDCLCGESSLPPAVKGGFLCFWNTSTKREGNCCNSVLFLCCSNYRWLLYSVVMLICRVYTTPSASLWEKSFRTATRSPKYNFDFSFL